jgi:iron(III) transport system substrate-binding protein
VTIYVSADRVFSEPVHRYQKRSGVRIHPDEGRRLIDYLLSAEVERQLALSEAVQIPLHAGVAWPKNIPAFETFKPMTLDYTKAAARVEDLTSRLAGILGL